jgi:hypothetical protein
MVNRVGLYGWNLQTRFRGHGRPSSNKKAKPVPRLGLVPQQKLIFSKFWLAD